MICDTDGIAAIILAAGYSFQMRDFKPLLRLGDFTAVEHAVRCFFQAGLRDVRVVAGYRALDVIDALKHYDVRIILNSRYNEGMYSSVQEGIKTLETEVQAFFILPADNPLVRTSTVHKILDRYHSAGKPGILYPVFDGRRGHPKLISAKYINTILHASHPDGLRGLLNNLEPDAVDVEVADEAVRLDINTQEDHRTLLNYLNNRTVPTLDLCRQIFHATKANLQLQAHCYIVAGLALALTNHLNKAGAFLDVDTVLAGALLHDIVSCHTEHDLVNSLLLANMSYPQVAEVTTVNPGKVLSENKPLSESDVVFLADKLVINQQIISISEYFTKLLGQQGRDRKARRAILRKQKQAELIKKKLETKIGFPIETIKLLDSVAPNIELPDSTKAVNRPPEYRHNGLQELPGKATYGFKTYSKFWLEKNGLVFSEALFNILTHIDSSGSIAQAARELGLSYRLTWGKIKAAESRWGIPLINTRLSDDRGGRTRLTAQAQELLSKYHLMQHEFDRLGQELTTNSAARPSIFDMLKA